MSKVTSASKPSRKAATGRILGTTKDGVKIITSGQPTHFTRKELRDAVQQVVGARKAG